MDIQIIEMRYFENYFIWRFSLGIFFFKYVIFAQNSKNHLKWFLD